MEFALTQEVSENIVKNGTSDIITAFSNELTTLFALKQYGDDLQTIYIGIICDSPEFDFFFKVRKPRYTKKKTIIQDGRPYELINYLTYDIKLNYEEVINAHRNELIKILSKEVIKSLNLFDTVKIKNFDKIRFKSDIIHFIENISPPDRSL